MLKESKIYTLINEDQKAMGDKAFQGALNVLVPLKAKPNKQLSIKAKFDNKALSSRRILIEHVFSRLKIFQIIGAVYRGDKKNLIVLTDIFTIICAIHNITLPKHPMSRQPQNRKEQSSGRKFTPEEQEEQEKVPKKLRIACEKDAKVERTKRQ